VIVDAGGIGRIVRRVEIERRLTMTRMIHLLVVMSCCAAIPAAGAQEFRRILENAFLIESKLLDEESERFVEARQREQVALDRMQKLSAELDRAISDQGVPVAELRSMEIDLSEARATAVERARETAALRERLYQRYDRLGELGAEIEQERTGGAGSQSRVDGTWRVEVPDFEAFAVLELTSEGTLIKGHYRGSQGSHGSIRGTLSRGRVEFERVDAYEGRDSSYKGTVDLERGTMSGSWQLKELGTGGPSSGSWSARRLSPGEDPGL
jgi:hypothetical protein